VVRVSAEKDQPFQVAFSVNQMKFAEYANPLARFQEIEAGMGNLQI
jgi:hypothetical protein